MSKNKLHILLAVFLGIITAVNFFWHVYLSRGDIFKKFDSTYWTMRYNESQWVVPNSKNSIGDDGLYMYVGYRYMQGDDPTLLNAELPPFGKYLVGFFEIATGVNGMFSVFFSGLSLVLLYVFNKKFFQSPALAMIPVTLFSLEPLFTSQIRAPYLDTLYLSCLLLGFLLLFSKKYLVSGIAFGLFMAVKSPFLVVVVYAAVFGWLLSTKQFNWKKALLMVCSTGVIFLLTYSATFFHGHGLIYFLKVQKYIIHFYSSGAKAVIGAVFPMLFTGKWYTWFSPVQQVAEWTVLWPIITIGTLISLFVVLKKHSSEVIFQLLWIGLYLIFLVITPVFARYLLLVIPFLYNLSIWSLCAVIKSKSS